MGGGSTRSSKLKKVARKMVVAACGSFSSSTMSSSPLPPSTIHSSSLSISSVCPTTAASSTTNSPEEYDDQDTIIHNFKGNITSNVNSKQSMCAICLEALNYSNGDSPGQAIFTAQCSHAFHFACISSNVRHGSVTCPICRAHWTQLPRNLNNPPCCLPSTQNDPVFQILDESIAHFRVHRRSFLRSARYDDDDPVDPDHIPTISRLHFSLQHHSQLLPGTSSSHFNRRMTAANATATACLSVKLINQPATDLVLVASPNGPHLRLLKQSMALVVFSLRPIDRLSIVTYSSAAARVFPLRRMTSYGKRTALQVIDRIFYMGQADPSEGLKKGIKVLEDRAHKNPHCGILHLSDTPTRACHVVALHTSFPVHRFHVGFGFGASNGFVMHEFEDFLGGILGGVIRDVQLRIGGDRSKIMKLGDLRGGEERRFLLDLGDYGEVISVEYSYNEGGIDECTRTGEAVVSLGEKSETHGSDVEASERDASMVSGRTSSVESWDYHNPYMARRWAKHLHGYRM
ncbi:unnamed protein product [Linum tenue]|uniref:RING-type domain-containing protein n=1 Tax=Linum tenue TaxID=586396 RepID=A0AAV0H357_9ROSI|nr:unnamed protein product [Linum tenue]